MKRMLFASKKTVAAIVYFALSTGTVNAYKVDVTKMSEKSLPTVAQDQSYWQGDLKNYKKMPSDINVAKIAVTFDRGEMGHLLDESVAILGRKECSKVGANRAYLASESHDGTTQDIDGIVLQCTYTTSPIEQPSKTQINAFVKKEMAQSDQQGALIEGYRKEVNNTAFGKAFISFSKSHPFNSSFKTPEELKSKLGLRAEAANRLNGRPDQRYYDIKTNQEVGQKEFWNRQHQYTADLYAKFLKENEALYKSEYQQLHAINEKYGGKLSSWALWPYLPVLDANSQIDYDSVKAHVVGTLQ